MFKLTTYLKNDNALHPIYTDYSEDRSELEALATERGGRNDSYVNILLTYSASDVEILR